MAEAPPPSLFGPAGPARNPATVGASAAARDASDLMDLLYDGFYMIFLLRNRYAPSSADEFIERIRAFLATFERGAQRLQGPAADIYLCKFAFCALVDEVVLASPLEIRGRWEQRPLQLQLFGEHLAGERFFEHLDKLRGEGVARVQVLEVFHMCLLLGFKGRYAMEGSEKLHFLCARVGDEIAQMRGRRAAFAPHWAAPDNVAHKLKNDVPLWVIGAVFALLAAVAYSGLNALLQRQTQVDLQRHTNVVTLAPQAAYVTITLP